MPQVENLLVDVVKPFDVTTENKLLPVFNRRGAQVSTAMHIIPKLLTNSTHCRLPVSCMAHCDGRYVLGIARRNCCPMVLAGGPTLEGGGLKRGISVLMHKDFTTAAGPACAARAYNYQPHKLPQVSESVRRSRSVPYCKVNF